MMRSMFSAAAAAFASNPSLVSEFGKLIGSVLKNPPKEIHAVIAEGLPATRRSRRRRRQNGSSSNSHLILSGKNAPTALGIATNQSRAGNRSLTGKAQICRLLGNFVSSSRVTDTEVMNLLVVTQQSTSSNGTYALYFGGASTGSINIGPAEIGPNRLFDVAGEFAFYAIRALRIRFVPAVTLSQTPQSSSLTAIGLSRTKNLGTATAPTNGDIVNFQDVRALENSFSCLGWERAFLNVRHNGEQYWECVSNGSISSPNQRFQFEMFGFSDSQSGGSGTSSTLVGYLEADYVVDLYEAIPNVGQAISLQTKYKDFLKNCPPPVTDDHGRKILKNWLPPARSVDEVLHHYDCHLAAQKSSHLSEDRKEPSDSKAEVVLPSPVPFSGWYSRSTR